MDLPAKHFGFLMVTADPRTRRGTKGNAWLLVRARLSSGRWPLFERTPFRDQMCRGARLGFYVGGRGRYRGSIVALATATDIQPWSARRGSVDPDSYSTDLASKVIFLDDIEYLDPPVDFRETLPDLSIRPKNLRLWGAVLMGGVRALEERFWWGGEQYEGRDPKLIAWETFERVQRRVVEGGGVADQVDVVADVGAALLLEQLDERAYLDGLEGGGVGEAPQVEGAHGGELRGAKQGDLEVASPGPAGHVGQALAGAVVKTAGLRQTAVYLIACSVAREKIANGSTPLAPRSPPPHRS